MYVYTEYVIYYVLSMYTHNHIYIYIYILYIYIYTYVYIYIYTYTYIIIYIYIYIYQSHSCPAAQLLSQLHTGFHSAPRPLACSESRGLDGLRSEQKDA